MWYIRRVVGQSMEPTLRHRQIVIVFQTRNFRINDVVVARIKGREVVKRITDKKDGRIYLEGDNKVASTDSNDYGWVMDTHIRGRVVLPSVKPKKPQTKSRLRKYK